MSTKVAGLSSMAVDGFKNQDSSHYGFLFLYTENISANTFSPCFMAHDPFFLKFKSLNGLYVIVFNTTQSGHRCVV